MEEQRHGEVRVQVQVRVQVLVLTFDPHKTFILKVSGFYLPWITDYPQLSTSAVPSALDRLKTSHEPRLLWSTLPLTRNSRLLQLIECFHGDRLSLAGIS